MAAMAMVANLGYTSSKPNTSNYYKQSSTSTSAPIGGIQVTTIGGYRRCRRPITATRREIMAVNVVERRKDKEEEDDDEEWRRYLEPEKLEVLTKMEPWVEEHMLPLLKPVEEAWQPSDLLPDPAALGAEGFHAACLELQEQAAGVPDDLLVCLVANMVTEEALPTYHSALNRGEAIRDVTGADDTPWARWIRGWSAEENRHGDVLNRYMYLSGRFDMREVERTVHRLIQSGVAMHPPSSAYHGFVYTSFQERATAISHGSTARLVGVHGDATLARLCGAVAADEKRHEFAYTRMMGKLFEADPDASVCAMEYMLRRRISMPTTPITDGRHDDFYTHFITIANRAGTYTLSDYRSILVHLIQQWRVEELAAGLSSEGRRARDFVCALPQRILTFEERALDRAAQARKKTKTMPISWIFDRHV